MSRRAQAPDEQEDQERVGHPAALILFALGAARTPLEAPLPGSVLICLLADLGLSDGAARSAILRMRRGGWLVSQRQGRVVTYAPSEHLLAGHRRRASVLTAPGPEWGGSFHALLFSVPEQDRSFRDELRRAAQTAGYRILRAGLLISPSDRRNELGDVLDRVPPRASVMPGWLELGPDDTGRVANELWTLDELQGRYRSLASRARAATELAALGRLDGAEAFRSFAAATLPIYRAAADDPGLPAELLPTGWQAPELGRALGEALRGFGPAVTAHIDALRARAAG